MNRYSYTKTKKDKNGVRSLKITRYPEILVRDTDTFHFARDFERFDWLAHKYYNDVNLWWVIARANPECFDGGIAVKPGKEYRIPADLSQIGREIVSGGGLLGSSTGGY